MGFEDMTPEQRREIAARGGRANKNRHKWTKETAKEAGRKGGIAVHAKYGEEHFSEMGKKGGKS